MWLLLACSKSPDRALDESDGSTGPGSDTELPDTSVPTVPTDPTPTPPTSTTTPTVPIEPPPDPCGPVGLTGAQLCVDRTPYEMGERLRFTFSGATDSGSDWIALFQADQWFDNAWISWVYVEGESGDRVVLPSSLPPGEYEARLFANDGYEELASVLFEVIDGGVDSPTPQDPADLGDLTVMTLNSWVGFTGVPHAETMAVDAVLAVNPDVLALQEGSLEAAESLRNGLATADLTWTSASVLGEADVFILTRLAVDHTLSAPSLHGVAFGAVLITDDGKQVRIVNVHLEYLNYGPYGIRDGDSVSDVLDTEETTRAEEIADVVGLLVEDEDSAIGALIVGDFNSPSALDWAAGNEDQNFGTAIAWPTTGLLTDAGFIDAYRDLHPDPTVDRGFTWTPGYPKGFVDYENEVHDRIDFVYHRPGTDAVLEPTSADVWAGDPWPSDHRAVLVRYRL